MEATRGGGRKRGWCDILQDGGDVLGADWERGKLKRQGGGFKRLWSSTDKKPAWKAQF